MKSFYLLAITSISIILPIYTRKHKTMDIFDSHEQHITGVIEIERGDMFYWLQESKNDPKNSPLILWLAGGPGCSGAQALFTEVGEFLLEDQTTSVKLNDYAWNNFANMLFVDNPVGVGFSTKNEDQAYTNTSQEVAEDLLVFLEKFLEEYTDYQKSDFYIVGESAGAQYTIALAELIFNKISEEKINLKGIVLAAGFVNAKDHLSTSPGWVEKNKENIGISEEDLLKYGEEIEKCIKKIYIDQEESINIADVMCLEAMKYAKGHPDPKINPYNIKAGFIDYNFQYIEDFVKLKKEALDGAKGKEVRNINFEVMNTMAADLITDYSEILKNIMKENDLKVLTYCGENDLVVNCDSQDEWIKNVLEEEELESPEEGTFKFINKEKEEFTYNKYKQGLLNVMKVENAGHMISMDNKRVPFLAFQKLLMDVDPVDPEKRKRRFKKFTKFNLKGLSKRSREKN